MPLYKLLHGMDVNPNNLTLTGLGVGCSAHADDIRTCCIGVEALNRQAADINQFISSNSLKINAEIVHLILIVTPTTADRIH